MAYYSNLLGIGPQVEILPVSRPTVSPFAGMYEPTGLLPMPTYAPMQPAVVAPAQPTVVASPNQPLPVIRTPRFPVMQGDSGGGSVPVDPIELKGDRHGSLDLGRKYGTIGLLSGIPFAGLLGSAIGNAQSAANAKAMGEWSTGVTPDMSPASGVANNLPFGLLGTSIADQLGNFMFEMGSTPDGDLFAFEDSDTTAMTPADLDQMISDANVAAIGLMNTIGGAYDEGMTDKYGGYLLSEMDDDLGPGGYDGDLGIADMDGGFF